MTYSVARKEKQFLVSLSTLHETEVSSISEDVAEKTCRRIPCSDSKLYLNNNNELVFYKDDHVGLPKRLATETLCSHKLRLSGHYRSIQVVEFVCTENEVVVRDTEGDLYHFLVSELCGNSNNILVKKISFFGGNRECERIVAGRSHFIAMTRMRKTRLLRRASSTYQDSCPDCENDADSFRLSTFMGEADHKAAMKLLNDAILDESVITLEPDSTEQTQPHMSDQLSTNEGSNLVASRDQVCYRSQHATVKRALALRRPRAQTLPSQCGTGNAETSEDPSLERKLTFDETFFEKSRSLSNPEDCRCSFVSMDRVSIREQMKDIQDPSLCSQQDWSHERKTLRVQEDFPSCPELWSWGANGKGQLGHNDYVYRSTPSLISALSNIYIIDVCCGDDHSVALSACGEVYIWGTCIYAQEEVILAPRIFKIGLDQFAFSISSNGLHTSILVCGRELHPMVLICDGQPENITKIASNVKDFLPIRINFEAEFLNITKVEESHWMERSVSLYFEASRMSRLIQSISSICRHINDSYKLFVEDSLARSTLDMLKSLSESLLHLYHVMCSSTYQLCTLFTTSKPEDVLDIYDFYASEVFLKSLLSVAKDYAVCEAFGTFHRSKLSKKIVATINHLALEYEMDSPKLESRIFLLFKLIIRWNATLAAHARKTVSTIPQQFDETWLPSVQSYIQTWEKHKHNMDLQMNTAKETWKYWSQFDQPANSPFFKPSRFVLDIFCMDCEVKKITSIVPRSFLSHRYYHLIVFSDVIMFDEKKAYHSVPLNLIWLERDAIENKSVLRLIAPEMEMLIEFSSDELMGKFQRLCGYWFDSSLQSTANIPSKRHGEHQFVGNSNEDLRNAHYNGDWDNGQINGKGVLYLANGDIMKGRFKDGSLNGFGIYLRAKKDISDASPVTLMSIFYVPPAINKTESHDIYRGVFHNGVLQGLAQIRYANGNSYDGYVRDGRAEGFGMFRCVEEEASLYVGSFKDDKKHGYGVYLYSNRTKKFLGMFCDDKAQGYGSLLSIDGAFHQGEWNERIFIRGLVFCQPTEGNFQLQCEGEFNGIGELSKGMMKVSPTMTLDGTFSGNILKGEMKVSEATIIHTTAKSAVEEMMPALPVLSKWDVPIKERWAILFQVFRQEELRCLNKAMPSVSDIWTNIVRSMVRGKDLVGGDVRQGFCDALERIPSYDSEWSFEYYSMVSEYYRLALDNSFHPLYRLSHGAIDVYITSYNMDAHFAMYAPAVLELSHLIEQMYHVIRELFPSLPDNAYETVPSLSDTSSYCSSVFTSPESSPEKLIHSSPTPSDSLMEVQVPVPVCDFLYEVFFHHCSPSLFTIYSLTSHSEGRNELYWNRAIYLNAHTDVKLLQYLDVHVDLWPIDIQNAGDLDKPLIRYTARAKFYESAIDRLKKLSSTPNPARKLVILAETFHEINMCVVRHTIDGANHVWNCDDLLPAFMYVVIRAQIRHLGSEIQMIDDFTRCYRGFGQIDLMFTMLQSSYIQICKEKSLA